VLVELGFQKKKYLLDNSDSDIAVGDVLSENEHVYEEESDSSGEEEEEDSSATREHVTGRQQGSGRINYLTPHADFQHFPFTLQNSGPRAHTAYQINQQSGGYECMFLAIVRLGIFQVLFHTFEVQLQKDSLGQIFRLHPGLCTIYVISYHSLLMEMVSIYIQTAFIPAANWLQND
jgi:hypothetical protein